MRLSLLGLVVTLLFPGLAAQTQKVAWQPDSNPTGRGNAFPWGSMGVRYQTIVPGTRLGVRVLVQDVFVAGDANRPDTEIVYRDIEIRMGPTPLLDPTTDWNKNNPAARVVYRGPLRVRFQKGKWRGIGLPTAFLTILPPTAPNLCFEVIVHDISGRKVGENFYFPPADSSVKRAFLRKWTQVGGAAAVGGGASKLGLLLDNGNFVTVGTGCQSSSGSKLEISSDTFPQAGKQIDVRLAGAAGSKPAVLMIGLSFRKLGALTLPFDLAPLGAAGCFVWNDILFIEPGATKADGTASRPLLIPAATGNARLYFHWWVWDPTANSFGWTTSSLGKMLLGN